MGNAFSGEEDEQTKKQNNYIKQQQEQIRKQSVQINQLLAAKSRPSVNSNQPNGNRPNGNRPNGNRPNENHPSHHNVKQVPKSAKTYMNPYKILRIDKNYDEKSLKTAYISMAMKTHPDKGGNKDVFQQVTIAYTLLLKKLKNRDSDRQHYELKSGHTDYRENGQTNLKQNINFADNERFDKDMFNKIYQENRLETVEDGGYGNWIEKNPMGDECEDTPKLFNGKYNKHLFNNVFQEYKASNQRQNKKHIIEYKEPQALNSGGHQLQVLGKNKIKDFSCEEAGGGLQYRDYKDAYTNSTLIDINSVNIGDRAKNIKSYQSQRSNISHTMSKEDEMKYMRLQKHKQGIEEHRMKKLERDDRNITSNYERIHKLLIRN
jgi:curved DNA-binding protein CbpA